jgi:hypothetical protein
VLGIDRFGASAPAETLLREYGFTLCQRNLLLDPLPDTALNRLLPQLEWDQMPLDRVLQESGVPRH